MKFAEINRRYTEAVAEWLAKGYTINTATMSGTQGELAKIDLTDGKEIIRVVLGTFGQPCTRIDGKYYSLQGVELIVGSVTDRATPNVPDTWQTVWNEHLDVISREEFFEIGQRYDTHRKWYGTKAEAMAQQDKNRERDEARRTSSRIELPEEAKGVVLSFVRRQPKCKSVKIADITKVTKEYRYRTEDGHFRDYARYTVVASGQTYKMK